jgi:hypothetical protein
VSGSRFRPGFRFRSSEGNQEEKWGYWIQWILLAVLVLALFALFLSSIHLLRAHLLEKYGFRAWILPVIIFLIDLLMLFRLFRLSRTKEEAQDGK